MLRTRNTVLRQAGDGAIDRRRLEDLLAVYDQQLARPAKKPRKRLCFMWRRWRAVMASVIYPGLSVRSTSRTIDPVGVGLLARGSAAYRAAGGSYVAPDR